MIATLLAQVSSQDEANSFFGVDSNVVTFWFSAFGALFLLVQAHIAFRNRRLAEIDSEREWVSRWRKHQDGWALATMLIRGADDAYAKGKSSLRKQFRALAEAEEATNAIIKPHERTEEEWEQALEEWATAYPELDAAKRDIEEPVREMIEFLDGMGRQVARGWLSPAVARAVVGPELLRSAPVIRGLVGTAYGSEFQPPTEVRVDDSLEGQGSEEELLNALSDYSQQFSPAVSWLDYYPAIRLRLLMLVDVVWAEAARRGELNAYDASEVAGVKRATGSGARNRRRLHKLCLVERRWPFSWWHSLRLQWLLTWAEHPREAIAQERADGEPYARLSVSAGQGKRGFWRRLCRLVARSPASQPWMQGWHI